MCLHLGNYAQERITTFTDTDGKTFTFQEYLKSRGLFACRFHVYWFSRLGSANGASQEGACRKPADLSPNDEDTFQTQDVFMGARKTQISGDFEHLMETSTPKTSAQEENQSVLLVLKNRVRKSPFPDQTVSGNKLHITYESVTNSSFSDVVMRVMSFSRAQCLRRLFFSSVTIRFRDQTRKLNLRGRHNNNWGK